MNNARRVSRNEISSKTKFIKIGLELKFQINRGRLMVPINLGLCKQLGYLGQAWYIFEKAVRSSGHTLVSAGNIRAVLDMQVILIAIGWRGAVQRHLVFDADTVSAEVLRYFERYGN